MAPNVGPFWVERTSEWNVLLKWKRISRITAEITAEMITRARTKLFGTLEGPTDRNEKTSDVALNFGTVDRDQTKVRSPDRTWWLDLKRNQQHEFQKQEPWLYADDASDGSQFDEDREISEIESADESQTEIERLKKQLAKLKANQVSRKQTNQSQLKSGDGSHREPIARRADPMEGRSLGTYNGRSDLDTFLVRFESCCRHFGWSESDKIFHLMNALTESAEPIVKEIGPAGTLENILGLLQIRFGNKLRLDNFHAELKRNNQRSRCRIFIWTCVDSEL